MTTTLRRRRTDLKLVPPGLVLPAESPADHLRNALQLLNLAWTRVEELNLLGCPELAELLSGAEARCFHALFALDGQPVRCGGCDLTFATSDERAHHERLTGHGGAPSCPWPREGDR